MPQSNLIIVSIFNEKEKKEKKERKSDEKIKTKKQPNTTLKTNVRALGCHCVAHT